VNTAIARSYNFEIMIDI